MLIIEELSVKRGKEKVLNNINLKVKRGEIVGLVGPNGAGKSTLIKTCSGVINKYEGKIFCDKINKDVQFEKYMENIQVCFDKAPFYPQLTGYQNLMQIARLYNINKRDVLEALKVVGLEKRMNDKIDKYSYGMLQRLNIAQVILTKRKLVFLDEPLNGIDPEGVCLFRNIFRKINEEYGSTLVISSHLLGELKNMCDRIVFMKSGKIVDDITICDDISSHIVEVEDARIVLKLNNKYKIRFISDRKVEVQTTEEQFNNFISELVMLGIKICNVESYNNVEKIYINKVGGN